MRAVSVHAKLWGFLYDVFSSRTAREAGTASCCIQRAGWTPDGKLQHVGETRLPSRQVGFLSLSSCLFQCEHDVTPPIDRQWRLFSVPHHKRATWDAPFVRPHEFCCRVCKEEGHNRMSPNSLAIVFAPCILRCPDNADPLLSMKDVAKTTT